MLVIMRSFLASAAGDTTAPTAPTITATETGDDSISVALTDASTDAVGVTAYELSWSANGSSGWTTLSSSASFPYAHTGLTPETLYYYRARARDAAANWSGYSSNTSATTDAASEQTSFVGGNFGMAEFLPRPAADLIWGSRGFGSPGTYSENLALARDANGWPTTASRIVVILGDYGGSVPTGTYSGYYEDSGSTTVSASAMANCSLSNIQRSGSTVTFDIVATANSIDVTLDFSGPVSNLRIMFPGYSNINDLRSEALTYYKQFWCLRGMDYMDTNASAETTWAATQPNAKRHGRRSWASLFQFATEIYNAADSKLEALWICVPHTADATYISSLASLAYSSLPSGMILYVEYSNELWNSAYPFNIQQDYVYDEANDTGGPDYSTINVGGADAWGRMKNLWGLKVARIADAFHDVFGSRARVVLAGQHSWLDGWTGSTLYFLNRAEIVATYGAPGSYIDALSSAPYPQGSEAQMDAAANVAAMLTGLNTTFDGALSVITPMMEDWVDLCTTYGIAEMTAYEWGPHTHGDGNALVKHDTHMAAGMRTLVHDLGSAMVAAGFTNLVYYQVNPRLASTSGPNSLWSVCEDFTDGSQKLQGLQDVMTDVGQ